MTWSGASSGEHFVASNPASGLFTQLFDNGANKYDARGFPGVAADGSTDDSAAINAATAQLPVGSTVDFGGATYKVLSLLGRNRINFRGQGATFIKNGGGAATSILNLTGTLSGTSTALTGGSAVIGATALAVTSSTGFAVGDPVLLADLTYKYATTGQNLEWNRVLSIPDGTHITVCNRLMGTYSSTPTITKVSPIQGVRIGGIRFLNPVGNSGGLVVGDLCYNVTVEGYDEYVGANDLPAVSFVRSAGCRVMGIRIYDGQHLATLGYGVIFGESSHHCTIEDCHFENIRENAFTNNARYCNFLGNTGRGFSDSMINTHGSGCEQCTIDDNLCSDSANDGITVGYSSQPGFDIDTLITNNQIINTAHVPILVASAVGKINKSIKVKNNTVRGWGLGSTPTCIGIQIDLSNDVTVQNNDVEGTGSTNEAYGIRFNNVQNGEIALNRVRDVTQGYGIAWQVTCDSLDITSNKVWNVGSYRFYDPGGGASTNIRLRSNSVDINTKSLAGTEMEQGNSWNTGALAEVGTSITTPGSAPPVSTNLGANVTSVIPAGNNVVGSLPIVMAGALAANTRIATLTWARSFGATAPEVLLVNQTSGVGLAIVNFYSTPSTGVSVDLFCDQALAAGTYTVKYLAMGRS